MNIWCPEDVVVEALLVSVAIEKRAERVGGGWGCGSSDTPLNAESTKGAFYSWLRMFRSVLSLVNLL